MRRVLFWSLILGVMAVVAACGKKSDETQTPSASTPSTTTSSAPASAAAFTVPTDLDVGPRAASEPINEALVAQGEGLFKTKGCSACHAFGKRVSCPDLNGVTQRRTAKWMQTQILHPDAMTKQDPIARGLFATYSLQMPKQGLTPDEANAVIEYFKHQNHEAGEKH